MTIFSDMVGSAKLRPGTMQANYTVVSRETVGMNSNRSHVIRQQERPEGELATHIVVCLIIVTHPHFYTSSYGDGEDQLRNQSLLRAREDGQFKSVSVH